MPYPVDGHPFISGLVIVNGSSHVSIPWYLFTSLFVPDRAIPLWHLHARFKLGPHIMSPSEIPPSAPSQNSYCPLEPSPYWCWVSGKTVKPAVTILLVDAVIVRPSFLAFFLVIRMAHLYHGIHKVPMLHHLSTR